MIKATKIKVGEIFEVDGKLYIIVLPTNGSQEVNTHGQIVCELHEIN